MIKTKQFASIVIIPYREKYVIQINRAIINSPIPLYEDHKYIFDYTPKLYNVNKRVLKMLEIHNNNIVTNALINNGYLIRELKNAESEK